MINQIIKTHKWEFDTFPTNGIEITYCNWLHTFWHPKNLKLMLYFYPQSAEKYQQTAYNNHTNRKQQIWQMGILLQLINKDNYRLSELQTHCGTLKKLKLVPVSTTNPQKKIQQPYPEHPRQAHQNLKNTKKEGDKRASYTTMKLTGK